MGHNDACNNYDLYLRPELNKPGINVRCHLDEWEKGFQKSSMHIEYYIRIGQNIQYASILVCIVNGSATNEE